MVLQRNNSNGNKKVLKPQLKNTYLLDKDQKKITITKTITVWDKCPSSEIHYNNQNEVVLHKNGMENEKLKQISKYLQQIPK